jgi:hypothetical protein
MVLLVNPSLDMAAQTSERIGAERGHAPVRA